MLSRARLRPGGDPRGFQRLTAYGSKLRRRILTSSGGLFNHNKSAPRQGFKNRPIPTCLSLTELAVAPFDGTELLASRRRPNSAEP